TTVDTMRRNLLGIGIWKTTCASRQSVVNISIICGGLCKCAPRSESHLERQCSGTPGGAQREMEQNPSQMRSGARSGRAPAFFRLDGERKPQSRDSAPCFRTVLERQRSAVRLRDLPAEDEADSRAAGFRREKWNEEVFRARD